MKIQNCCEIDVLFFQMYGRGHIAAVAETQPSLFSSWFKESEFQKVILKCVLTWEATIMYDCM